MEKIHYSIGVCCEMTKQCFLLFLLKLRWVWVSNLTKLDWELSVSRWRKKMDLIWKSFFYVSAVFSNEIDVSHFSLDLVMAINTHNNWSLLVWEHSCYKPRRTFDMIVGYSHLLFTPCSSTCTMIFYHNMFYNVFTICLLLCCYISSD